MPNHCTNTLSIVGEPYKVRNFCRDHYRTPQEWDNNEQSDSKTMLDFSSSVPYPDTLEEREKYRNTMSSGWYSWHCEKWGTKWNAYGINPDSFPDIIDESVTSETNGITQVYYTFDTAWSQPESWLQKASIKYPDLVFGLSYIEEGMGFGGKVVYKNGENLGDEFYDNIMESVCTEEEMKKAQDDWDNLPDDYYERIRDISEISLDILRGYVII